MTTFKKNPLLARPPWHFHRLRDESRLAEHEDPHLGVNTTGTWNIAAAYAMSAWKKNSRYGYPVVVTLDVTGLQALPDVDALLKSKDELAWMRNEALQFLNQDEDVWDLAERWSENDYNWGSLYSPEEAVFQQYHTDLNPFSAAIDLYDEGAEDVIRKWAEGGTLPSELLSHLIDQRRYLNDFDLDRVVRIETFRPWFDRIVEDYWGEKERAGELKKVDDEGYYVIFLDEVYDYGGDFGSERVTLYEGIDSDDTQYHGSMSAMIQQAFPELDLPDIYWEIEPGVEP